MKRTFSASVWREGDRWVAQCRELDVAGGGGNEGEALASLREAVGLLLSLPGDEATPPVRFERPWAFRTTGRSQAGVVTVPLARTFEVDAGWWPML